MKQFLSSNTQDFIEVGILIASVRIFHIFLSSNTQDFIEVAYVDGALAEKANIPEL